MEMDLVLKFVDESIAAVEHVQNTADIPTIVSRRLGAVAKHLKEIRHDFQPLEQTLQHQREREAEKKKEG